MKYFLPFMALLLSLPQAATSQDLWDRGFKVLSYHLEALDGEWQSSGLVQDSTEPLRYRLVIDMYSPIQLQYPGILLEDRNDPERTYGYQGFDLYLHPSQTIGVYVVPYPDSVFDPGAYYLHLFQADQLLFFDEFGTPAPLSEGGDQFSLTSTTDEIRITPGEGVVDLKAWLFSGGSLLQFQRQTGPIRFLQEHAAEHNYYLLLECRPNGGEKRSFYGRLE